MRKLQMSELASAMFAASIFFTLMIAPELFAERIAENPESLYQGYVAMVGSQQNLAFISLGVTMLIFGSFFIRNYNARIMVDTVAIVYTSFITASYVFNYPNLALGLLVIMIIWQIYETNKLIDESEDEKSKQILKKSLEKEEIEDDSRERTKNSKRSKD
ncbi:MAG TPA: hypothetical protein DEB42_00600 [Jeotgalicoccus sp.]|nr:hypothetical protein [Jeotgalicoccus sp.]